MTTNQATNLPTFQPNKQTNKKPNNNQKATKKYERKYFISRRTPKIHGVRHMVKDHSASKRKPAAATWANHFRLAARGLLYAPSHRQDSTYTAFGKPVVKHWL